jgi:cysteinyl-tRNA synthetase
MSSSLGNFVTVSDAVDRWGANVLRVFFTAGSYDSRQLYSDETIAEAEERWERLERAYERATDALDSPDARTKREDDALREAVDEARASFTAAMNDDFNTREAQSALLAVASAINRHTEDEEYDYRGLKRAVETLEELGDVLGLTFDGETAGDVDLAGDVVELVLEAREREREAGNYDRADELRDELEAIGVEVQDTDEGPTYRLDSGG